MTVQACGQLHEERNGLSGQSLMVPWALQGCLCHGAPVMFMMRLVAGNM